MPALHSACVFEDGRRIIGRIDCWLWALPSRARPGADAKISVTSDLVLQDSSITMFNLPLLKPDPIPSLHPVPEFLAEGELKARYEDMKAVLGVPWMGVVTMSFAHYLAFYDALWQGTRTLCGSRDFTDAC